MSAPWRLYIALLLTACLVAASSTVQHLNAEAGGWCMAILLLALPLGWASLSSASPRHRAALTLFAIGIFALSGVVRSRSNWHVIVAIPDPHGLFTLSDRGSYWEPSLEPERIPLMSVNDAWTLRSLDDRSCLLMWWNNCEQLSAQAPFDSFFRERAQSLGNARMPLAILMAMALGVLAVCIHAFVKTLRARGWHYLPVPLTVFFGAGILVACFVRPPGTWLDNEFLSRPDDWLCYETGARSVLKGNLFLMPPPGRVELWSSSYAPLVAALHMLLGPSLAPLYVVQFASNLLLVPLGLRLFRQVLPSFRLLAGFGLSLFVLIDLNLHYAWHLLSDVLPLLLVMVLLIALNEQRSAWLIGVLCGLLYWSRSELILIGPMVMVYFWWKHERTSNERRIVFALWLVPVLLYLVRWYALYGTIRPFPVGMEGTGHVPLAVMFTVEHMILKLRALLGDYAALNSDLRIRYHWFAVHALFMFTVVRWLRHTNGPSIAALTFSLWAYVLATRMLSPSVGIYGHRHSLLLVLLEGLFVAFVLAQERWSVLETDARPVRLPSADLGPIKSRPE